MQVQANHKMTWLVAAVAAALLAMLAVLFLVSRPAAAAEKGLADKGEVLVRENCSRCHAIGKEGDSPHPPAPPFRTLSSKYPVEDLADHSPRASSPAIPTCPSSCLARMTSRPSSNICRASRPSKGTPLSGAAA